MAVKRPVWAVLTLLGVCAVVVYLADQLSKFWVKNTLPEGVSNPVVGDFLQFYFVRNPGAAFSIASGSTWIFSILAAIVTIVIIVFARKIRSISWAVVFGLLLGGTLGNLTDRLTQQNAEGVVEFGHGLVIDFIYTPWMMPAIYNIADIAIVSSMCLLVILTFSGIHIDGTRDARKKNTNETPIGSNPTVTLQGGLTGQGGLGDGGAGGAGGN